MGSLAQVTVGSHTGTGAAATVTTGFRPKFVLMFNQTDGNKLVGFIDGMTAATGFTVDTEVAAIASQGITLTSRGFTLGTDAECNASGKVFIWVAFN